MTEHTHTTPVKRLSWLADAIEASPTIALIDQGRALQAQGVDVITLAGGEPDFDTPKNIVDACIAALHAGHTNYASPAKGIPPLLDAIEGKMARENDIHIDGRKNVVVTPGAKWSIYLGLASIVNQGDEVLLLEPAWVSYREMVKMLGGVPVTVQLSSEDNFAVTQETIAPYITERTRAVLINTPCNPTGRVFTQAELEAIASLARKHDLFVISDEIYEGLLFDDSQHTSIATLPDMFERTITISGLSKNYAMTGWRMGWLTAPDDIAGLAAILNTQTVTAAPTFVMHAAVEALNGPQDSVESMRTIYAERALFVAEALNAMDGITCPTPEGTFYLFPCFTKTTLSSMEIANIFINEGHVTLIPGSAFGDAGEGHVRISVTSSMDNLKQALERIEGCMSQINNA